MVGSNYSQELKDRGLTVPGALRKVWDYTGAVGGPILKNRLWFFATAREEGSERGVPGMFANKNAGDPTKFLYEADLTRPAVLAASYRIYTTRFTSQITPRNKASFYWDEQQPCEGGAAAGFSGGACRKSPENGFVYAGSTAAPTPSASAIASPDIAAFRDHGVRVQQARWTSPVSNNFLLDAAWGSYKSYYGGIPIPGLDTADLTGSLYTLFASSYDLVIDGAEQTLWGEAAEGATARRLEASVHTPLLVFRRVSTAAGRPVEYVVSRYRGDRYQVHMSLGAASGAGGKTSSTRRDRS